MIIRNPCKRCIVQPLCQEKCSDRTKYTSTINTLSNLFAGLILALIFYILTTIIIGQAEDRNAIFVTVCYFALGLSLLQFWCVRICKEAKIYDGNRFIIRVIKLRPIKPPPPPKPPSKRKGP